MAVVVTELFPSRPGEMSGAIARCTRSFHVEGEGDPLKAIVVPGIPPSLDELDFNGIKIKLRRHSVRRTVNKNICQIDCEYDNDGSSAGPQLPDDRDELYTDFSVTYARTTERIPAFILFKDTTVEQLAPGVPGPPAVTKAERWDRVEIDTDSYVATAEVVVNVTTMSADTQRQIAAQVNALHKFPDGLYWQYTGATTTRKKTDVWQLVHRWNHDPGQGVNVRTNSNGDPAAGDKLIMRPFGEQGDFEWVDSNTATALLPAGSMIFPNVARPSFGQYLPKPQAEPYSTNGGVNPRDYRPRVVAIPAAAVKRIVPLGWRGLPGNPIT